MRCACVDAPKPRSPRYARVECTLTFAELWMRIIVVLRRSRINSRWEYRHECGRALQFAVSLQESRHKTTVTKLVWISRDVPVKVTRRFFFPYGLHIYYIYYEEYNISQNNFSSWHAIVDFYQRRLVLAPNPWPFHLCHGFNRRGFVGYYFSRLK